MTFIQILQINIFGHFWAKLIVFKRRLKVEAQTSFRLRMISFTHQALKNTKKNINFLVLCTLRHRVQH